MYENQSAVCTTLTFNRAEQASVERRGIKLIISIQSWRRGWEDWKVETPVFCVWRSANIWSKYSSAFLESGLETVPDPLYYMLLATNEYAWKKSMLSFHETNWNSVKMYQKIFYINLFTFCGFNESNIKSIEMLHKSFFTSFDWKIF